MRDYCPADQSGAIWLRKKFTASVLVLCDHCGVSWENRGVWFNMLLGYLGIVCTTYKRYLFQFCLTID